MKIGIIGAGFVGRAVAKQAIKAGHQVMLSNSRGPQTLFSLKPMIGCETGTATEAAIFGQIVVIAVPLTAIGQLQVAELDQQTTTTSEYLAGFLPQSKITKAFNAIQMTDLETDGLPAGDPKRRALPLAGDDKATKQIIISLYDAFGFDAVDAGALSEGWRFQRAMPSYCVRMTKAELEGVLAQARRPAPVAN